MGNVVLAGAGSLFAGLGERLNNELMRNFPHVKIHAPGNPAERRYGSWLGGSILASLGTFHQLWISKEEWQVSLAPCHAGSALTQPRSMADQSLLSDVNKLFQLFVRLIPLFHVVFDSVLASVSVENKEHQHVSCHIFPLTYVIYMPRTRH